MIDFEELAVRKLYGQGAAWALGRDAAMARKILEAVDRQTSAQGQEGQPPPSSDPASPG